MREQKNLFLILLCLVTFSAPMSLAHTFLYPNDNAYENTRSPPSLSAVCDTISQISR